MVSVAFQNITVNYSQKVLGTADNSHSLLFCITALGQKYLSFGIFLQLCIDLKWSQVLLSIPAMIVFTFDYRLIAALLLASGYFNASGTDEFA
jgi:hypothetical protein